MRYFAGLSKNVNTTRTFTYDLPYRIHLLYKITNIQTYIATYISRIPILYTIGFTQTAMDCLTLTVIAHLCGQLGVLSIRISNLDVVNKSYELNEIIQRHQKLIKYGLLCSKINLLSQWKSFDSFMNNYCLYSIH